MQNKIAGARGGTALSTQVKVLLTVTLLSGCMVSGSNTARGSAVAGVNSRSKRTISPEQCRNTRLVVEQYPRFREALKGRLQACKGVKMPPGPTKNNQRYGHIGLGR